MEEQTQEGTYSRIAEPTVRFRVNSDRIVREVVNADTNQPLIRISGYDLQFDFNMQFLKSLEDIEAACNGMKELCRNIIMEAFMERDKQSK